MKSIKTILGIGAGVLLVALLVVFRAEVVGVLARFRATFGAATDPSFTYEAFKDLERENAELKTQLDSAAVAAPGQEHLYAYRAAQVYSHYPMDGGGRITISVGSDDGIREGMPVLLSPGTLIGRVTAVRRTQSEVETIWSTTWKSAAKVLPDGAKVLLQGGTAPRLDLVSKSAVFVEGARAVNVSPEFPMGLLVGTVGKRGDDSGGLWLSYGLQPPADENTLSAVLVVLNFP